jgi:hypothetical protein
VRRAVLAAIATIFVAITACSPAEHRDDKTGAPVVSGASGPALVGHERLQKFVPSVSGWKLERSYSADVRLPAPASHVRATFTQGPAQIEFELTDTAGDAAYVQALANVAGGDFHQEAPNGYMKAVTMGGFPGLESFNSDDKIGEISVLINRRFLIHASGTGTGAIDPVRELISHVDLAGIAALK